MSHVAVAIALGLAAGFLSGMFGVGGGILFVPTLTLLLDLGQLAAEATSLAAIVPVVAVGAWRQRTYGNVDLRASVVIGLLSIGGVAAGTAVATQLPEHVLQKLFGVLLVFVAVQIFLRARSA
ncbi:MAG TPA: sulfite exporter TauE/SafE family protein [Gaiellaceae bacterium]|jgi:hypothetical protein